MISRRTVRVSGENILTLHGKKLVKICDFFSNISII